MSQFDPLQRNVSKTRLALRRWFPERQFIVRSGETVRSLKISTASQVAITAAGLAVGTWIAVASAVFVSHEAIVAAKDTEVERAQSAYEGLLTQVSVYKERIAAITDSLERNHAHILSLVDQNMTLDDRLQTMQQRLATTAEERNRIARQSADLTGHIKKLRSEIASAAAAGVGEAARPMTPTDLIGMTPAALVRELGSPEMQRAVASRERESLQAGLTRLEADLGAPAETAAATDAVATVLDSIEEELQRVVEQRDRAHAERETMQRRVAELEGRLQEMEDTQLSLFSRFADLAGDKIADIEDSLASTGIDLPTLMEKANKQYGTGGPFIPDDDIIAPETKPTPLDMQEDKVSLRLDHLDVLTRLATTMPLLKPLPQGYRISSRFGRRSDPINGRGAVHEGLDMVSAYKTPVTAPGPGKVVYAGWRGRYGRLVEIDHGMGLRTRYGHLAKVLVKKGQRIQAGAEIGLLGNSGRSTGAHLHYEVLVNGEPHDPMKFIKAGSDVFKG